MMSLKKKYIYIILRVFKKKKKKYFFTNLCTHMFMYTIRIYIIHDNSYSPTEYENIRSSKRISHICALFLYERMIF